MLPLFKESKQFYNKQFRQIFLFTVKTYNITRMKILPK